MQAAPCRKNRIIVQQPDDPPDDMMSDGCPACKWATSCLDNLYKCTGEKDFECRQCDWRLCLLWRCNTDSPTTAYQLVEHVYRKGKRCEYHELVWLYVLECAKKVAASDECAYQRSTDFVCNIPELITGQYGKLVANTTLIFTEKLTASRLMVAPAKVTPHSISCGTY